MSFTFSQRKFVYFLQSVVWYKKKQGFASQFYDVRQMLENDSLNNFFR
jgi:hypothetical protein